MKVGENYADKRSSGKTKNQFLYFEILWKDGFNTTYRDENGYRNYNEEDIHKIERIMFLRDINVPIEDIKDILDNKVTFQDVLENHIEKWIPK